MIPKNVEAKDKLVKEIVEAKELTKLLTVKRKKGHSIYEYFKGEVSKLEVIADMLVLTKTGAKKQSRINLRHGAVYTLRLNYKNAVKEFERSGYPCAAKCPGSNNGVHDMVLDKDFPGYEFCSKCDFTI